MFAGGLVIGDLLARAFGSELFLDTASLNEGEGSSTSPSAHLLEEQVRQDAARLASSWGEGMPRHALFAYTPKEGLRVASLFGNEQQSVFEASEVSVWEKIAYGATFLMLGALIYALHRLSARTPRALEGEKDAATDRGNVKAPAQKVSGESVASEEAVRGAAVPEETGRLSSPSADEREDFEEVDLDDLIIRDDEVERDEERRASRPGPIELTSEFPGRASFFEEPREWYAEADAGKQQDIDHLSALLTSWLEGARFHTDFQERIQPGTPRDVSLLIIKRSVELAKRRKVANAASILWESTYDVLNVELGFLTDFHEGLERDGTRKLGVIIIPPSLNPLSEAEIAGAGAMGPETQREPAAARAVRVERPPRPDRLAAAAARSNPVREAVTRLTMEEGIGKLLQDVGVDVEVDAIEVAVRLATVMHHPLTRELDPESRRVRYRMDHADSAKVLLGLAGAYARSRGEKVTRQDLIDVAGRFRLWSPAAVEFALETPLHKLAHSHLMVKALQRESPAIMDPPPVAQESGKAWFEGLTPRAKAELEPQILQVSDRLYAEPWFELRGQEVRLEAARLIVMESARVFTSLQGIELFPYQVHAMLKGREGFADVEVLDVVDLTELPPSLREEGEAVTRREGAARVERVDEGDRWFEALSPTERARFASLVQDVLHKLDSPVHPWFSQLDDQGRLELARSIVKESQVEGSGVTAERLISRERFQALIDARELNVTIDRAFFVQEGARNSSFIPPALPGLAEASIPPPPTLPSTPLARTTNATESGVCGAGQAWFESLTREQQMRVQPRIASARAQLIKQPAFSQLGEEAVTEAARIIVMTVQAEQTMRELILSHDRILPAAEMKRLLTDHGFEASSLDIEQGMAFTRDTSVPASHEDALRPVFSRGLASLAPAADSPTSGRPALSERSLGELVQRLKGSEQIEGLESFYHMHIPEETIRCAADLAEAYRRQSPMPMTRESALLALISRAAVKMHFQGVKELTPTHLQPLVSAEGAIATDWDPPSLGSLNGVRTKADERASSSVPAPERYERVSLSELLSSVPPSREEIPPPPLLPVDISAIASEAPPSSSEVAVCEEERNERFVRDTLIGFEELGIFEQADILQRFQEKLSGALARPEFQRHLSEDGSVMEEGMRSILVVMYEGLDPDLRDVLELKEATSGELKELELEALLERLVVDFREYGFMDQVEMLRSVEAEMRAMGPANGERRMIGEEEIRLALQRRAREAKPGELFSEISVRDRSAPEARAPFGSHGRGVLRGR